MPSRWHRPRHGDAWIMGVLNCTPDSFSDGGRHLGFEKALAHGRHLAAQGAALVDVGGESTRPGSQPVALDEELERVIPVIGALARDGIAVSVDTMKAGVMRAAIEAGACMVNDVSALSHDAESLDVVAGAGVDVCLMHMRGTPATMQQKPHYEDVVAEVTTYFEQRIEACLGAGIREDAILLDPGIGFGKRLEDNLRLIAAIPVFRRRFGMPLLLGVSRKSFLGMLTGAQVTDREIETAAADAIGVFLGADVLRVHDVAAQARAARVAVALAEGAAPAPGLHDTASSLS